MDAAQFPQQDEFEFGVSEQHTDEELFSMFDPDPLVRRAHVYFFRAMVLLLATEGLHIIKAARCRAHASIRGIICSGFTHIASSITSSKPYGYEIKAICGRSRGCKLADRRCRGTPI